METSKPVRSCVGCIYYYVTWDPRSPKGCKFFGFKSAQMPCIVVKKSSGQDCNMYEKKGSGTKGRGSGNGNNEIDRRI